MNCGSDQETLHIHNDEDAIIDGQAYNEKAKLLEAEEETEEEVEKKRVEKAEDSIWAVFKNRHLVSAVLVYCTWSMHNMAYTEVSSLASACGILTGVIGAPLCLPGSCLPNLKVR